jgi:outer membrane receptor for ferrienterochelin and colicins
VQFRAYLCHFTRLIEDASSRRYADVTSRQSGSWQQPSIQTNIRCRSVFALLWLIVPVFPLLSQEPPRATIRVEVRTDTRPVAGAVVTVNGISMQTGQSGIAIIALPLGMAEVSVTKEGFFPSKASLLISEAREWPMTVEIKPQEQREEEVTVFATRTDTRLQDLPTRVEVLGQEEIDEKTMMTPGDIVMMLNEMGGLRVQSTSPSLGAASVRIQGMRGRYTAFLSDGLPLFGQQGGGLGLLQIPPVDLGQVEVIKGVASALYGAGAMAGVVNLISRRPSPEPAHEILFNRSTRGATDTSLFVASQLTPHWGASFLGTGDWQEHNDIDHDGWADIAEYDRGVVRPRFFWDNGNGRTGFLTGGVTYENRDGGTISGAVLPAKGAPYTEALNTRRYDLGGNLQVIVGKRYIVTARLAASLQDHDHRFGDVRERDRHQLLFGELTARGAFRRNTWVVGVAAEREAYLPRDVPQFTYRYTTPGVFGQDDIEIAPWLSVSASARVDFQNQYGTFLSPRVSALIRWGGWVSRLSAGLGFFAPTPLTEETEAAGLTRLVIPKPLIAERGRSASIDLTRKIGPVYYTVTVFNSSVRHPINVDRTEAYELINLARPTHNVGLEFLSTLRKAPFSATLSYTYVHSRQFEFGEYVDTPLTPRQSLGLVGIWEKEKVGRIGVESYYTGHQRLEENPYRSESKAYVLFGFLAEHTFGHFRLFVNVENLTDVRQTRWNPLLRPERGIDGRWTVDAWAPLDGRVVNGGIRLKF